MKCAACQRNIYRGGECRSMLRRRSRSRSRTGSRCWRWRKWCRRDACSRTGLCLGAYRSHRAWRPAENARLCRKWCIRCCGEAQSATDHGLGAYRPGWTRLSANDARCWRWRKWCRRDACSRTGLCLGAYRARRAWRPAENAGLCRKWCIRCCSEAKSTASHRLGASVACRARIATYDAWSGWISAASSIASKRKNGEQDSNHTVEQFLDVVETGSGNEQRFSNGRTLYYFNKNKLAEEMEILK
jgi:hypothetical protein